MTEWLYVVGGVISALVPILAAVRWLVRQYLRELVPNGGGSIKDQVNRLERDVQMILQHILTNK